MAILNFDLRNIKTLGSGFANVEPGVYWAKIKKIVSDQVSNSGDKMFIMVTYEIIQGPGLENKFPGAIVNQRYQITETGLGFFRAVLNSCGFDDDWLSVNGNNIDTEMLISRELGITVVKNDQYTNVKSTYGRDAYIKQCSVGTKEQPPKAPANNQQMQQQQQQQQAAVMQSIAPPAMQQAFVYGGNGNGQQIPAFQSQFTQQIPVQQVQVPAQQVQVPVQQKWETIIPEKWEAPIPVCEPAVIEFPSPKAPPKA